MWCHVLDWPIRRFRQGFDNHRESLIRSQNVASCCIHPAVFKQQIFSKKCTAWPLVAMLLPFSVGQYSVTPALLEHFIPAFNGSNFDGGMFLQLNATRKADNLILNLVQPGGSWQNLCLVPLLIALNLTFAFVMQCIARHTRISENMRQGKRAEDKYSAFTALIRDLSGVQSVYFISQGWLTNPSYRWISRSLCLLTIVHWFAREWLYANFLSSLTANLTNAVVALPSSKAPWMLGHHLCFPRSLPSLVCKVSFLCWNDLHSAAKDLSLVYSRLFSMLAWQIATAPLFLIFVPSSVHEKHGRHGPNHEM